MKFSQSLWMLPLCAAEMNSDWFLSCLLFIALLARMSYTDEALSDECMQTPCSEERSVTETNWEDL